MTYVGNRLADCKSSTKNVTAGEAGQVPVDNCQKLARHFTFRGSYCIASDLYVLLLSQAAANTLTVERAVRAEMYLFSAQSKGLCRSDHARVLMESA